MARVTVDNVDKYETRHNAEFFKLENDGDSAVVRFILDKPDDVDVLAVHEIPVPNSQFRRKVSCLKNEPTEPNDVCPLCAAGYTTSLSVYIQMYVYEQDENGYYTKAPKQVIWERGKSYLKKLISLGNRYCARGKRFIDTVFEIERSGVKGDTKTTYEIYPMTDQLEPNECPIPTEINKVDPLGTIVLDKSFDELDTFVTTGTMPTTDSTKTPQEEVIRRPQKPAEFSVNTNDIPFDVNEPAPVAAQNPTTAVPNRPIRRRI